MLCCLIFYHIKRSGSVIFFCFQAEDGIRALTVTGVQTCALPIFIDSAGALDRATFGDADLVLLAVPVGQMRAVMRSIAPLLGEETVVTDAGSTKQDVVDLARRELKKSLSRFVPGHPIAGTEKSGAEAALVGLYRGRRVVLTPLEGTDTDALARTRAAWEACGARGFELQPREHDAVLATVSHLPHVLAYALVDQVARQK